jgi:hypothetical protein
MLFGVSHVGRLLALRFYLNDFSISVLLFEMIIH